MSSGFWLLHQILKYLLFWTFYLNSCHIHSIPFQPPPYFISRPAIRIQVTFCSNPLNWSWPYRSPLIEKTQKLLLLLLLLFLLLLLCVCMYVCIYVCMNECNVMYYWHILPFNILYLKESKRKTASYLTNTISKHLHFSPVLGIQLFRFLTILNAWSVNCSCMSHNEEQSNESLVCYFCCWVRLFVVVVFSFGEGFKLFLTLI